MRKVVFSTLILLFLSVAAVGQKSQKASDILKAAQSKAADQNKSIFLIFGASWSDACHQLDTFLALPGIATIFDQHFVTARLTFGEAAAGHPGWDTPGSDTLIAKYGGIDSAGKVGLPFIALLDAKGKLVVNSNAPASGKAKGETTGFPTEPDERKWFLSMLEKAAPTITADELHRVEAGLRQVTAE